MKKYIIIATMLMLSVPTLVGCGKEKVSTKGGASANATQKIASGEKMTQKSFEKCKNESISIVCQMIEFDDTNVRKELIEVMKRCFNQQ